MLLPNVIVFIIGTRSTGVASDARTPVSRRCEDFYRSPSCLRQADTSPRAPVAGVEADHRRLPALMQDSAASRVRRLPAGAACWRCARALRLGLLRALRGRCRAAAKVVPGGPIAAGTN